MKVFFALKGSKLYYYYYFYIKVGCKGCKSHGHVFVMENSHNRLSFFWHQRLKMPTELENLSRAIYVTSKSHSPFISKALFNFFCSKMSRTRRQILSSGATVFEEAVKVVFVVLRANMHYKLKSSYGDVTLPFSVTFRVAIFTRQD